MKKVILLVTVLGSVAFAKDKVVNDEYQTMDMNQFNSALSYKGKMNLPKLKEGCQSSTGQFHEVGSAGFAGCAIERSNSQQKVAPGNNMETQHQIEWQSENK